MEKVGDRWGREGEGGRTSGRELFLLLSYRVKDNSFKKPKRKCTQSKDINYTETCTNLKRLIMKVDRGSSNEPRPFPSTQNHMRLMMGEPSMKQGGNHLFAPLSRTSHITWHLKCAAVSISPFAGTWSLGLESGPFAAFLELRPCASPTQPEDSCWVPPPLSTPSVLRRTREVSWLGAAAGRTPQRTAEFSSFMRRKP